jgi:hypothetical protein
MFKTVQTEELITATGGLSLTSLHPELPSNINLEPPVWPRKVDGHRASVLPNTGSPHVGF